MPVHQFSFRNKHSSLEQAHRIVREISTYWSNRHCSSVFVDVAQAFGNSFMSPIENLRRITDIQHRMVESYLQDGKFSVKYRERAGVHAHCPCLSQGNVLSSSLFAISAVHVRKEESTVIVSCIDYTSVVPSDIDADAAVQKLGGIWRDHK